MTNINQPGQQQPGKKTPGSGAPTKPQQGNLGDKQNQIPQKDRFGKTDKL
jgi:hypothetical protein